MRWSIVGRCRTVFKKNEHLRTRDKWNFDFKRLGIAPKQSIKLFLSQIWPKYTFCNIGNPTLRVWIFQQNEAAKLILTWGEALPQLSHCLYTRKYRSSTYGTVLYYFYPGWALLWSFCRVCRSDILTRHLGGPEKVRGPQVKAGHHRAAMYVLCDNMQSNVSVLTCWWKENQSLQSVHVQLCESCLIGQT